MTSPEGCPVPSRLEAAEEEVRKLRAVVDTARDLVAAQDVWTSSFLYLDMKRADEAYKNLRAALESVSSDG